jgi:hypothetical protein
MTRFIVEESANEPLIDPKLQALLDAKISSKQEKGKSHKG